MKIAIIGHGNVGGTLAVKWADKGHKIIVGARNLQSDKLQKLQATLPQARITSIPIAMREAEIILVATPPQVALDLIEVGGALEGKVVIDATNAIRSHPEPYPTVYHAFADRTDARVVKCFNSTGFENMLDPNYEGQKLDMFAAGDDEKAKETAIMLSLDAGFGSCIDFGGGDKVKLLEDFAMAWINLAIMQGMGRNIGIKILTR